MQPFDQWWDSDERFTVAHEDEKTQARAAWNAALDAVARHAGTQLRQHDIDALRWAPIVPGAAKDDGTGRVSAYDTTWPDMHPHPKGVSK